jgi:thioredoxin type arsenate reductase
MIGTFSIVFAGCGGIMILERYPNVFSHSAIPVVFGLVVAVMIYALGHISGAHFNPAVTASFTVMRRFSIKEMMAYWSAQIFGSCLAMFFLVFLLPKGSQFGATVPSVSWIHAVAEEAVLTFILMFVIITVSAGKRVNRMVAGVSIGATVMFCAFIGGSATGASMNPARSLGPAIFEKKLDVLWLYIIGPLAGAILAVFVYKFIQSQKAKKDKENKKMKKRVLILCTGNSCRSQMAEGILKHYGQDKFEVRSGGSQPSKVNETAIKVMKEIGIDISHQRSKHVKEFLGQHFHYIITVCDKAKESCPTFPGVSKRFHWPFPDPPHQSEITEEVLEEFRRVRDMIHEKFKNAALSGFEAE